MGRGSTGRLSLALLLTCGVGVSCGSGAGRTGSGGSVGQGLGGASGGGLGGGARGTGGGAASSVGGSTAAGGTGGVAGASNGAGGSGTGGHLTGAGGAGGGAAGVSGGAAGSSPVQAYDGARGVAFDDGWKFHLGDVTGAQTTTFDDSSWRSLACRTTGARSSPFNKSSPAGGGGGFVDGGVGWYRKTFTVDASISGQKIRIEFDGVYMNSQVWINGISLGTRPYGYSTFQYDLTPYVKFGASNVIAVRADNSSQPNSRWYSGSGIYRNVWLTVLNPVHVAYNGAFITTPSVTATSASVSIAADVENQSSDSQSVTITTEVRDASGAVVASTTTEPAALPPVRRRRCTRASPFRFPTSGRRRAVPLSGQAHRAGRAHRWSTPTSSRSGCGHSSFDPSKGFLSRTGSP